MGNYITFKEVGTIIKMEACLDEEFIKDKLAKMFTSGIKNEKSTKETFHLYSLFIECFFSVALNNSEAAMFMETAINAYKKQSLESVNGLLNELNLNGNKQD